MYQLDDAERRRWTEDLRCSQLEVVTVVVPACKTADEVVTFLMELAPLRFTLARRADYPALPAAQVAVMVAYPSGELRSVAAVVEDAPGGYQVTVNDPLIPLDPGADQPIHDIPAFTTVLTFWAIDCSDAFGNGA